MRRLRRLGVRLGILLGCGLSLSVLLILGSRMDLQAFAKDFGQDYILARILLEPGPDPYQAMNQLADRYLGGSSAFYVKTIPTPHPLTAGLMVLPLGLVDYVTALRIWFAVQMASLVGTTVLATHLAGFSVRPAIVVAVSLLACLWQPALLDITIGQVTLPIALLLALAEWQCVRRQPAAAGVLCGLSLLLKPLAWPWLLVMLRRRSWSAVVGCVATVAVCYFAVALRLGLAPLVDYFTRVLPQVSGGYALEITNTSIWAVAPQVFRSTSVPTSVVSVFFAGGLLACVWWAAGPNRPTWYGLSMATAASTIISPISWFYYLVLLIVPGAHILAHLRRSMWPRRLTAAAMLVAVWISVPWPMWYTLRLINPILGFGVTAGVLAVMAVLIAIAHGV